MSRELPYQVTESYSHPCTTQHNIYQQPYLSNDIACKEPIRGKNKYPAGVSHDNVVATVGISIVSQLDIIVRTQLE